MEKKRAEIVGTPRHEREEVKMQGQPKICNKMHASCDRNPKCTCTTVIDANGYHPGSHTSPFHVWF